MKLKLAALVLFIAAGIVSCNKFKVSTTDDGDRLIVHEKGKSGKLGKEGDMVTFDMEIKTSGDSTLNSSYQIGTPFNGPLQKGYFKGSFENALFHIGEGDSTTVLVSSDSLFKMMGQPVPPFIEKGSDVRFIVRMHKIQSQEEVEKESMDRKAGEPKIIEDYVSKNMKDAQNIEGIYYTQKTPGAGAMAKDGDRVLVKYVGKFVDGKIFDQGEGLDVVIGEGRVISGWETALKTMKAGGESTFIIPSSVAYGERGSGPIPASTPLVFDITLQEIVKK